MLPVNKANDPNDPSKIGQETDDPCRQLLIEARVLARALIDLDYQVQQGGATEEEIELAHALLDRAKGPAV
jgi:hypothetical protein